MDDVMRNGDVLLVADATELAVLEQFADVWDPVLRRNLGYVIRELGVAEVALRIARPDGQLLPQDHAMWADLREELAPDGIRVREPVGLPAAA